MLHEAIRPFEGDHAINALIAAQEMEARSYNGASEGSSALSSYWSASLYLHKTNDRLGGNVKSVTNRAKESQCFFATLSEKLSSIELKQQPFASLTNSRIT